MAGTTNICPRYEAAAELLGKRWTGLLLRVLLDGPRRFSELASAVAGMSERMLSERLKELESQGVVDRRVYPEPPVKVEYRLTPKGQALGEVVDAIGRWAEKWVDVPHQHAGEPAPKRRRSG
jgi:DNA-binding HxlR family transcriptional regulator